MSRSDDRPVGAPRRAPATAQRTGRDLSEALRKPYRIAILVPDLTIEGDAAYEAEAALLLWMVCIEACRRHSGLAVHDAEATPLVPQDGHFVAQHAIAGANPDHPEFTAARRDELVWLELSLARRAVRLHAVARGGTRASFDSVGRGLGEQIHNVFASWLSARQLDPLPQPIDPVSLDDVLAAVRVLGPALVEHARVWSPPDSSEPPATSPDGEVDVAADAAAPSRAATRARAVAQRLPAALRVPALRVLELAFRDELPDLILAADPDHPQAMFATFLVATDRETDFARLRRIIATAPGWTPPRCELTERSHGPALRHGEACADAPSDLEIVASATIAAVCQPASLDVIERAAECLRERGRVDEAVRLVARTVRSCGGSSGAHTALLRVQRSTDRIGTWVEQAHRSSYLHGCPMDPALPWYPDQIRIDLLAADALLHAGRLDEAIALRGNRLEGREAAWPRQAKTLAIWRKDPRFVAWSYAREGWFRGDPARAVEGFGRIEPGDGVDLAAFLDALVATGREDEVPLAWGQFGLGRGFSGPVARLAASRCLIAAGEWRRGLEELWRVQLTEPGRDDHAAIARCGRLLAIVPLAVAETALAERLAIGAHTLARRMARDIADFVPGAADSAIVVRALGKTTPTEFDPACLAGFPSQGRGGAARHAIDALVSAAEADPMVRADRLVNGWLEVVFSGASEQDSPALAQAAAYAAAQALGRYLAATTSAPSVVSGGLRCVAAEALALVARHRDALGDREARALLGVLDPLLRRVDRWLGIDWLAAVERACGIDERSIGDVAGFASEHATVRSRILGFEDAAVLADSVARLHRDRPPGWQSAVVAQASRLALHTGRAGVDEWADATAAELAAGSIERDDAIDSLLTACYLAEGSSARPCLRAARVLLDADRVPAAIAVLTAGLAAASPEERDRELGELAEPWRKAEADIPFAFERVASRVFESLQAGDAARAERLGRWAVAFDPKNGEAHRNLGLALAQQANVVDAIHHLVRGTREQATQILSGVLYQSGQLVEAMRVLDYASRWYVRADQWLTYGGVAYAAMDNPRTVKAYAFAYRLDPEAFDASQLNAYAGVLDEVGDYATCETIADRLLRIAGDDVMWKTNAWNHLACAYIGLGRFEHAVTLAQQAVEQNPLADNSAGFAATLERAQTQTRTTPPALQPIGARREPVFELLEAGAFAAAAALASDESWRVRRAAIAATRFRFGSESAVEVTPRARATATAALADTVGTVEREAVLCRVTAMQIREQAYFPRDPVPQLGDRMTRDAFYSEFRARGGVVLGDDAPPPPPFVDRVVVPGAVVARVSDYVALLRDLAALTPHEALAQFHLDDAGYLELAGAWAAAMQADPTIATTIAAGLAGR